MHVKRVSRLQRNDKRRKRSEFVKRESQKNPNVCIMENKKEKTKEHRGHAMNDIRSPMSHDLRRFANVSGFGV